MVELNSCQAFFRVSGSMIKRLPISAKDVYKRQVLYLFYYEGYKVREISEIKGKNENTIHTWLKRGREALREKLGGELDDFR